MTLKFPVIILISATACSAGIIPTVEVLQGPSSKTTLLGPDGSALDAAAPGGTVVTNNHGSGLVAAGPALLPAAGAPIVVHGPAGSIATTYTLAGPAVVPGVPVATAAAPAIPTAVVTGPAGGPIIAPIAAPVAISAASAGVYASGQGAYYPYDREKLYDDGSYKGDH